MMAPPHNSTIIRHECLSHQVTPNPRNGPLGLTDVITHTLIHTLCTSVAADISNAHVHAHTQYRKV